MATEVFVIDDDRKLTGLLEQYLTQYGFQVRSFHLPDEGIAAVRKQNPTFVVLDLMLPGKDGFQVCREIRSFSKVPILMLTARGETSDRIVGLELGADDYLPKPFEPRELVARIQAVLRRTVAPSAEVVRRLVCDGLSVDVQRREALLNGSALDLTTAEFDLLVLFMKSAGKTLDRDAILNALHGQDWDAYSRTVDVTLSRLRHKLMDDPKHGRFFKTVRGAGYLFVGKVESQ
jgi:DNA-binding response OmpR family regulator